MRYRELIEAPIQDMDFVGDMDNAGSFRADDLKKFRKPEWKDRVVHLFRNSPWNWEVHIVNGRADGKVKSSSKYSFDYISTEHASDYVGIHSQSWAESIVNHPLDTSGKITILLLTNEGTDRVGMTPWMVAHRIGHCFLEGNDRFENMKLNNLAYGTQACLTNMSRNMLVYYQDIGEVSSYTSALMHKNLSTFRSARTGNVRDAGEYPVELFAEFILNGAVKFKTDWIAGDPKTSKIFDPLDKACIEASMKTGIDIYAAYKWESRLTDLFAAMKGDPLRPRTRALLRAHIEDMLDRDIDGEYRDDVFPSHTWTHGELMHHQVQIAQNTINKNFTEMVNSCVGKVLVL